VRIISGSAKGRPILCPGGLRTRPTSDRVREAIFSIIGDRVKGTGVVDLFAGTGAYGLEALSRGALKATFVDRSSTAARFIRKNAAACRFESLSSVVTAPVVPFIINGGITDGTGLVFVDPPYGGSEGIKALMALSENAKSLTGGLLVFECSSFGEPDVIPSGLEITDRRRYGDTAVIFLMVS